ncbi:Aste57867_22159 [Aphanomyces stellatus]|uniref:Aste57867_22159 protein n=1 Tax=Aphanomyces stellatus TaxID=120398 RepID=A0A485LK46_9STRA|nr:hypothetical protein As57867_022090 [Aphanomyces stellatus]VFT98826.1 Aste57867_22159 [Aphanomyces stellatus]
MDTTDRLPTAIADDDKAQMEGRLRDLIQEWGLTPLGQNIAFMWLSKAATDDSNKLMRLRQWTVMELNKQRRPAGVSPWQHGCPGLMPGLKSQPVWRDNDLRAVFPWIRTLEEAFPRIRDELLGLKHDPSSFQPYRAPSWAGVKPAADGIGSISHDAGEWNVFYLYLHDVDYEHNRERCPITTSVLESIDTQYTHAFFSALAPRTHITAHHGPTNKKLRCHLPLVVPPGEGACRLRVGDETIYVREGECFVFDDSFEHEAWNDHATKSRIVLVVDVWHPSFSPPEVKFFKFLQKARMKVERRCTEADADGFYQILKDAEQVEPSPESIWSGVAEE